MMKDRSRKYYGGYIVLPEQALGAPRITVHSEITPYLMLTVYLVLIFNAERCCYLCVKHDETVKLRA